MLAITMRRSPLKRKTSLKRKTPLRRTSTLRRTQLRKYSELRLAFLRRHVACWICGELATEVHHTAGRNGVRLCDFDHCMAVCFLCHKKIHDNPKWARENGFLEK